ncbi:hypothetical protein, partial [Spiroplasma endosymbiont of Megaselia nigra]|uniref:hypothetical protein n=1 Tax=Spiroplasma endosymbiont of Megaselia nigra TaxID=2478537 RepID=UPI0019D42A04
VISPPLTTEVKRVAILNFIFRQSLSPCGNKQKIVYPVINYASSIPTQLYIKKITFWSSNPLVFLVSDIVFFGLTALFLWKQAKKHMLWHFASD